MLYSCVNSEPAESRGRRLIGSSPTCLIGVSESVDRTGVTRLWLLILQGFLRVRSWVPCSFLFISTICEILFHTAIICYADDLQIYFSFYPHEAEAALVRIAEDVTAIQRWVSANFLKLNARKTKAILLGSTRYVNDLLRKNAINLSVDGTRIELSSSVRDLGLIIGCTLSWNEHIREMARRISGVLWRLKYNKKCLSIPLRKQLVTSLVFPIFDYCGAVFTDLTGQQKLKLKRIMNSCVRFIFDLRKDEHITEWYTRLNWLAADERLRFLTGCFLHTILGTNTPLYIASHIHWNTNRRARAMTEHPVLVVPSCRTATFQKSFRVAAPEFWNSLPPSIREIDSASSFRNALFTHLRQQTN